MDSTQATLRRAPAGDGLFIVGLVGRTGSGKSTVARVLAEDGAVVIDADVLGHEVTDGDPDVRAALIADYGAAVYRADGRLDRAQVAARVFRDPAARARLDALVHPRIIERVRRAIAAVAAAGRPRVVVLDAALMLEWGMERECDAIVAVVAPDAERIARLAAARGWNTDEAARRLDAQRPDAAFSAAADVTLFNSNAARDALAGSVRAVVRELEARRALRSRPTGDSSC